MNEQTEQLAAALQAAMAAAGAAAGRTLPAGDPVEVGEPFMGPDTPPAPGEGSRALSARLVGDITGTVVLAVAAPVAEAVEHGPVAPQEFVPGLSPTVADAVEAMAANLGIGVSVESVHEVGGDVAFSGADSQPFVAVVLQAGGAHAGTLAVVLEDPAEPTAEPGAEPAAEAGAQPAGALPEIDDAAAAAGVDPLSAPVAEQTATNGNGRHAPLEILHDVEMGVTAELGRTRMTVRDLLTLAPGSIVELDRAAGSPVDVLVNGTLVARGEVVVIDEEFGIRISEIVGLGEAGR